MITAKEAERIVAECVHELHPTYKIYSYGWGEDDEYYDPMVGTGVASKGGPSFLVNKQTGEVVRFRYWPNTPIAERLKAMKRTKYLFRKVIIRP
ncbi:MULTISPECIES: hypothetical protein [unclassified Actinotignum]|uniref:hypothetical protein n=1 Tax=unclassified Actinotignum TaxID=2632702 RepID=UPI003F48D2E7